MKNNDSTNANVKYGHITEHEHELVTYMLSYMKRGKNSQQLVKNTSNVRSVSLGELIHWTFAISFVSAPKVCVHVKFCENCHCYLSQIY